MVLKCFPDVLFAVASEGHGLMFLCQASVGLHGFLIPFFVGKSKHLELTTVLCHSMSATKGLA